MLERLLDEDMNTPIYDWKVWIYCSFLAAAVPIIIPAVQFGYVFNLWKKYNKPVSKEHCSCSCLGCQGCRLVCHEEGLQDCRQGRRLRGWKRRSWRYDPSTTRELSYTAFKVEGKTIFIIYSIKNNLQSTQLAEWWFSTRTMFVCVCSGMKSTIYPGLIQEKRVVQYCTCAHGECLPSSWGNRTLWKRATSIFQNCIL